MLPISVINASDFINEMWNTTFSPWTELFYNYVGNGDIFYLFPLIIFTVGIYIKTDHNSMVTSMFMIGSGASLAVGSLSMGVPSLPILFGIFSAIGLIPLFTYIIYGE